MKLDNLNTRIQPRQQILIAIALSILISSCTNSRLLIRPLYNRLDDQIESNFREYGDFTPKQLAVLEKAADTFHVWHRQTQLPEYATFLQSISDSITTPGKTTARQVQDWFVQSRSYRQAMLDCHPINFSYAEMQALSQSQIDQIEERIQKRRQKRRQDRVERTSEERVMQRVANIEKTASRINITFTGMQRQLLRKTLRQQKSVGDKVRSRSQDWYDRLFATIRQQDASDYDERLAALFSERWMLWEATAPEEIQYNRRLWQKFALDFIDSMTPTQRRVAAKWSNKMVRTIRSLANDTPSYQSANDSSVGCLVNRA